MNELTIKEGHEYRRELMDDIRKCRNDKLKYHIEKIGIYSGNDDKLGIINRIQGDELRSHKNHMLSINSMCCLAAEFGGLSDITSHYLAEKYAILIEESRNRKQLISIMNEFLSVYLDPLKRDVFDEGIAFEEKVNRIIGRKFMENISVQSIADEFYFSREHVSRMYKLKTGQTINDKIIEVRIREAALFLRQTTMTITEIAITVGFHSSQYFSRVFKKSMDLTPSEYRRLKMSQ
ncbi:helix-turn-helix transcriptional regulator [Aerococcaceae bacterium 50-4]